MAKILEFRASPSEKPVKLRRRRNRRSAEIVIFPGVRYERWAEATQSGQGGSSTSTPAPREKLQLVE